MTIVAYFGFGPDASGAIDTTTTGFSDEGSDSLVKYAHAAGTKVVMSIGGWNTEGGFENATTSGNLNKFVSEIVSIVRNFGYDGVDIDWEPLYTVQDSGQFTNLIKTLRDSLAHPYLLTSTDERWDDGSGTLMNSLQTFLDQINIMTYDMSGAWQDWVTWYNGSLHTYGMASTNGGEAYANCDSTINIFLEAGVAAAKLGIGSEFAGAVWNGGVTTNGTGVTGPNQAWTTAPTIYFDVPLYWSDGSGILQKYYKSQNYHWDSQAQASYLSVTGPADSDDYFISYEDTNDINAKFNYISQRGLGGLIIYELGWGYPGNGTYPLLALVKRDRGAGGSQPPPSEAFVYHDSLLSPWMDVSNEDTTINYKDNSHVFPGDKYSIKVVNDPWNALSVHYGTWNSGMSLNDSLYKTIQVYVYSDSSTTFGVTLGYDQGGSFAWSYTGNLTPQKWDTISVTLSQMDTSNSPFDRIYLQEGSGVKRTYYVDDLLLTSSSQGKNFRFVPGNKIASQLPSKFAMEQNYPNPFNPTTTINYSLPKDSYTQMSVFNILGQRVATLVDGSVKAGYHQVVFDGDRFASGVYFYVMRADGQVFKLKMLLLK